jgi:hypothetical protein
MEEVFKAHSNKFFGTSGREYPKDEVQEVNGQFWHCHGVGMPVIEVGELEDGDTRMHSGYPKNAKE